MRPSSRPTVSPPPHPYRTQILDHLGLVAGMFDALSIGDVLDQATHHNPDRRDLTVGEAVKALGLHGLGVINQALPLVPHCCQHQPTSRLLMPRGTPKPLHDDALGRALETLSASGVTTLSSLIAAPAAPRLGLGSRFVHLDSTSFHVDGRYNSEEDSDEPVIHLPRGSSRDQRPDLNPVMRDLIVEPQAGLPVLMQPLSGHRSDVQDFGQLITDHMAQVQRTYGPAFLVADSAL